MLKKGENKVMLCLSTIAVAAGVIATSLTTEEAAFAGALAGFALSTIIGFFVLWFVLQVIADWKIFTKAGQAGWKCLIPIYNHYVEYDICWKGSYGLLYVLCVCITTWIGNSGNVSTGMSILSAAAGLFALFFSIIEAEKLAKAFGKGIGYGILLFLFGPIMRIILGFGSSTYAGNPS